MGSIHVNEMRAEPDPLLKFRFEVFLDATIQGFSSQDVEKVQKRVTTISPLFEIVLTHANAPSANSHWYYLEDDDVSSLTFTLTEHNDFLSFKYFQAWKDMMINSGDGTYNAPKHYKKDITTILYKADFESEVASVKVVGASPSRISGSEASYEGSDPVNIEIEVTFDSLKFEISGD